MCFFSSLVHYSALSFLTPRAEYRLIRPCSLACASPPVSTITDSNTLLPLSQSTAKLTPGFTYIVRLPGGKSFVWRGSQAKGHLLDSALRLHKQLFSVCWTQNSRKRKGQGHQGILASQSFLDQLRFASSQKHPHSLLRRRVQALPPQWRRNRSHPSCWRRWVGARTPSLHCLRPRRARASATQYGRGWSTTPAVSQGYVSGRCVVFIADEARLPARTCPAHRWGVARGTRTE